MTVSVGTGYPNHTSEGNSHSGGKRGSRSVNFSVGTGHTDQTPEGIVMVVVV